MYDIVCMSVCTMHLFICSFVWTSQRAMTARWCRRQASSSLAILLSKLSSSLSFNQNRFPWHLPHMQLDSTLQYLNLPSLPDMKPVARSSCESEAMSECRLSWQPFSPTVRRETAQSDFLRLWTSADVFRASVVALKELLRLLEVPLDKNLSNAVHLQKLLALQVAPRDPPQPIGKATRRKWPTKCVCARNIDTVADSAADDDGDNEWLGNFQDLYLQENYERGLGLRRNERKV